ncbi:MAG: ABC transporter permease [Actinobacteria bacterium]|nr:ABC transporter permease [Actinomycetota bacterium]
MRNLRVVWIIWLREVKRYLREKIRIITSLTMPALYLFVLGKGLGSSMAMRGAPPGFDFRQFLFPGILGMTVLMTAIFAAISIVWDREFGFLKEVMVAPVPRWTITLGKGLGGSTVAMMQGVIMLLLAPTIGINLTPAIVAQVVPLLFLVAFSITSMGIVVAARMKTMEGFQMIMNFFLMPMLFLSGAIFSLKNAPGWMSFLSKFDPLTYGVDALRGIMLPEMQPLHSISFNVVVVAFFSTVMIGLAVFAFNRQD